MKKASNKIALIVFILLTLSYAIFAFVSYEESKHSIIAVSEKSKEASVRSMHTFLDTNFEPKIFAVESLVEFLQKNPSLLSDLDLLKQRLADMARTSKLIAFFIGFDNTGELIDAERESGNLKILHLTVEKDKFDLRTRPWYQVAARKAALAFTDPYTSATSSERYVAVSKPVIINGKIVAVVATELALSDISVAVHKVQDSETSRTVVVDIEKLTMVHHPNKEAIMSQEPAIKQTSETLVENFKQRHFTIKTLKA